MAVERWMSWEGGVDLCAATRAGLAMPNVLIHVARVVHTPLGSAPAGMLLWQPDPQAAPAIAGFVCTDEKIGAYFGSAIFAGTPFEHLPVLKAKIEIHTNGGKSASSRVEVAGFVFETRLENLGALEMIQRAPLPTAPFHQQGLEARSSGASLKVNGKATEILLPPMGPGGGPAALWAPAGIYAR
ncbi:MAG: hypothetical protein JNM84_18695 [Planctomycetes bacterium]|nr:hypothetical protein [Planctomycetota bacterium]